jgi:hypothetical protein
MKNSGPAENSCFAVVDHSSLRASRREPSYAFTAAVPLAPRRHHPSQRNPDRRAAVVQACLDHNRGAHLRGAEPAKSMDRRPDAEVSRCSTMSGQSKSNLRASRKARLICNSSSISSGRRVEQKYRSISGGTSGWQYRIWAHHAVPLSELIIPHRRPREKSHPCHRTIRKTRVIAKLGFC